VDCPGHASLIRTIIGGAQIIDMMLLVIDIVKGVQTQTAECLIIGEISCNKMLIVLNKLDLIEESKRESTIEKVLF
jgi:selenocysteine-specific elongation factor